MRLKTINAAILLAITASTAACSGYQAQGRPEEMPEPDAYQNATQAR